MDGGPGSDTFVGAVGNSLLDYSARTAAVAVSIDGVANDGASGEGDNVGAAIGRVRGGAGDDTMLGDEGVDNFDGLGGSDVLTGGGGNDSLGGYDLYLDGDEENDGDDRLDGGAGSDDLRGDVGNDAIDGGTGDDVIDGGAGTDDMRGGEGRDFASLSAIPRNVITSLVVTLDDIANDGRAGERDNVHSDIEDIETWTGDDTITGTAGPNVLLSYSGNDTLDAGGGADEIYGEGGDDIIRARDGVNDLVSCGSGSDTVIVDAVDTVADSCENVDRAAAPPPPPGPPPPPPPLPPPTPPIDSDGDGTADAADACPMEDARPRDENGNGCLDLRRLKATFTLTPGRYVKLSRDGRRYVRLGVTVRSLDARGLPPGARVRVTCTQRACKPQTLRVGPSGRALFPKMQGRKLRTRTRLVLRATLLGTVGAGATYTIRPNSVAKQSFCIRPDGRSGSCSTVR